MSAVARSAAIPEEVDRLLRRHLLRRDRQEDICFALWRPSHGRTRQTALVQSLLLPRTGDRNVHRNASFEPQYFERALMEARRQGAGLALLHSHPFGARWQGMSPDDVNAERNNAPAVFGATKLPFVGLTLAGDGAWSARFWERTAPRTYIRNWCGTVRIVGNEFRVTYMDDLAPPPPATGAQKRTISAWGDDCQADLVRRRVLVAGAGSVGGFIAESLARTGFEDIMLMDFDTVKEHNLDRLCYATPTDVGRPKVDVLADRLKSIATAANFRVEALPLAVYEEEGFLAALDCDAIFSCVDRPWGRYALNLIAYAHLIPVYDGGIAIRTNRHKKLIAADWRAHAATPGRACLQCLGQYDSGFVQTEREGRLDDPKYIEALPESHPLKMRENVFAFSMNCASLQSLQMLAHVIAPLKQSNPGAQRYHFVGGFMETADFPKCEPTCEYPSFIAEGDHAGIRLTGPDWPFLYQAVC